MLIRFVLKAHCSRI